MKKLNHFLSRKNIAVIWMIFVFSVSPVAVRRAAAWDAFPAAMAQTALEQVLEMVKKAIVGAMKQAGAMAIDKSISNIVSGGSSGSPMFITDYRVFLNVGPRQNTQNYMNDYLSQVTGGKGSISGYISSGSTCPTNSSASTGSSSSGSNFISDMQKSFSKTMEGLIFTVDYSGDPSQMFCSGNSFQNLYAYMSGNNNPWAFSINAQSVYQQKLAQEKSAAATEGMAGSGFTGSKKNGTIVTPGSVVMQSMAGSLDLGNKILAGASSIPEVITAVVSKMITSTIQGGIGNIQANVQRTETSAQTNQATAASAATDGPSAYYQYYYYE